MKLETFVDILKTRDLVEEEMRLFNEKMQNLMGEDSLCMYYKPMEMLNDLIEKILVNEMGESTEGAEWFIYDGIEQIKNEGTKISEKNENDTDKVWKINSYEDYYTYLSEVCEK